jgi:serine/threonine protein kinase/outer membrane biosynthesis protein TonB
VAEAPKKKIGKYEVIEELGRGAMGVVYRARDPFIGRLVALKTITPGLLDNPELLQRFYREAQAAGQLQHPNIVIIYDLGEADGLPYIAMEFLEGKSLEKLIHETPAMPLAQKLNIIIQLCRGLDFAHKHGVVHRDIKPGNIIVMKGGTVKVVDFGIVRLSSTSMTSTGMVIGTVGYMSPEQAQGEHVDARSDLFSVGVVMYELFAYKKPFAGPNVAAVLIKIVTEEPPPLADAAPQVPPALCEIVHRCLKKNPAERFQSLEDLVLELEPFARSLQRDMVEELVKQGQELIEKQDFTEARSILRDALKLDSSHGLAKTLMGKVDTEIRKLEIHPKIQKFMETGEGLLAEGKYEEATKQFEEVLKLDTQHGQAQEMLEKAREEMARAAQVRQGLSASQQALNQGDLTVAQVELEKVLDLDTENADAKALLEKLGGERAARERRARLQEAMRQARTLLIQENYEECVKHLEGAQKEFPKEEELRQLLQTAREGFEEKKRRQALAAKTNEARNLLIQQKYEECVKLLEGAQKEFPQEEEIKQLLVSAQQGLERKAVSAQTDEARALLAKREYKKALSLLDKLLQKHPEETTVIKLRALVEQEQKEQERQQRLEKEKAALRGLIEKKDYGAALTHGEALQKEFTDDTEIGRLVATVRVEKRNAERLEQITAARQSIQKLLEASKFDQAIQEAEKALKKFKAEPDLTQLLATAKAAKEEHAKKAEMERRMRSIKGAIERGDLTDAIDLGRQTLALAPEDTDVTQLLNIAERELESREKKRKRDDQLKTALLHLEDKEIDQATMILRDVAKEFPFDGGIKQLLKAAEAGEVPADAATMIGMAPAGAQPAETAPSAETQYVMQGPPASAAAPAGPTASTQPQPVPTTPPEVRVPPVAPPPKAKPAAPPVAEPKPEIKAPPPPKPEVKPPPPKPKPEVRPPAAPPEVRAVPAPAVAVPEVPLWKKPAGMAIGGVLAIVLVAGVYFGLVRGGGAPATETPETVTEQTQAPSPMDLQQGLIDEAQKLADAGSYDGALAKLSEAEKIQGPLGNRVTQLRQQINEEVQNAGLRKIRQQEAQLWTQAEAHLNANRFDQAERAFQQVLSLPEGGRRRADAQRYLKEVIPQRRQEEQLFAQGKTAAQQRDNESRLQEADRLLGQVVAMNGPRRQEALQLQNSVKQQLDQLAAAKGEAARQQQIAGLENQIRQDIRQEDYQAARQKVEQIGRLQGDTAGISSEIDRAEQEKFSGLEGRFRSAQQAKNTSALEGLRGEFRKLAEAGGPVASRARAYADNQIPQAISDIEAAARQPVPTPAPPTPSIRRVSCEVMPVTPGKYDRPVRSGSPMGQKFIDGGVNLQNSSSPTCGLPASVFQGAGENQEVLVMVNIDTNGRVTGGRHLSGNAATGKSVLDAASQSWQFSPPKVNGTPVTTTASVRIRY